MLNKKCLLSIVSIAVLWLPAALAGENRPSNVLDAVLEISKRIFSHDVDSVSETPIRGLFEVASGTTVLYIGEEGKFAIEGDIFDLADGNNLTEGKRNRARMDAIDGLTGKGMIVFAPDEVRHTITVFTDVDCSYCRKLHNEVSLLKDAGIAMQYVGFPRAGPSSDTYKKMVSVWCANDRQKAMTDAKKGKSVPAKQCSHPLDKYLDIGRKIGVRGTPAIVLEDGTLISGYLPAKRLQDILEKTFDGHISHGRQ
uniref:Thiol:disulfide interchange protein n=1 Tax=Candidatus Kentrum eta TaxID=2126337 RepID=A0A450VC90_9GAMM|nr:MAG: thiol:disulfide interchange protein DsbC [Candidatus Kentron sp. H]VFK02571.1 MAG: thiol:disulfide interchange protein DsbC [Candidatus Kentron sp. H]VFK05520.1 MAG: thiol:disulfide interchange protein DsbC [Candidatus Kentron sp. H]